MKKLILFLLLIPVLSLGQTGTLSTIPNYEYGGTLTPLYPNVTYVDLNLQYKGIEPQQGTITERPQANFITGKVDCSYYESGTKTDHLLVFLVGKGEVGDCLGGNIQALYKYGFPKLIKTGNFDFTFNILMIQPCGASYPPNFQKTLLPWINETYHPSKIILSGISLGAICSIDMLTQDEFKLISGVVSLSGTPSASKGIDEALSRMRFVPGYAVHGTADNVVSYSKQKKFIDAYNLKNSGTDNVFVFEEIIGAGHTAEVWNNAMSYGSNLHRWIVDQFGPEEPNNEYSKGYLDGLNKAKVSIDSLINVDLGQ